MPLNIKQETNLPSSVAPKINDNRLKSTSRDVSLEPKKYGILNEQYK